MVETNVQLIQHLSKVTSSPAQVLDMLTANGWLAQTAHPAAPADNATPPAPGETRTTRLLVLQFWSESAATICNSRLYCQGWSNLERAQGATACNGRRHVKLALKTLSSGPFADRADRVKMI